jgi:hypothetical protein
VAACALLLALPAGDPAWAQSPQPTVAVTATIAAQASSQAALVITLRPADALPRGTFIRVRGLPTMAALSEGHSIAPGSWAVPIAALPNLKITLPNTAAGRSEISVSLVAIDGTVLSEARSVLVVASPAPAPRQGKAPPLSILRAGPPVPDASQQAPLSPRAGGSASRLPPAARERALRLLKKGHEELADGGIAQARLLYERAAEAGLPEGAMAVAATFDADELGRLGVQGLQPDPAAARRWYERAEQLGATEAAQRLRRLGAR